MSSLPQGKHCGIEEFCGQRPTTDASDVGFVDTDDAIDGAWWESRAAGSVGGHGCGRGDERIGAEVNVEEHSLRSLQQNRLAFKECVVQHGLGIGNVWA